MITIKDIDFILDGIAYWFKPNNGNSYNKGLCYKADIVKGTLRNKRLSTKREYELAKQFVESKEQ